MSMLEARYFVAKISDAQAVLCDEELATLERLIRKVDDGRRANGKSSLTCVVVEEDWPNWQQTVDSVLSLADGKTTIGPMPHQNKSRPFGSMTQFGKLWMAGINGLKISTCWWTVPRWLLSGNLLAWNQGSLSSYEADG